MAFARPAGRVITFYSYKGGTGRSMALANMAWILAANGKRVLVIDWDLEAPGLHRYFKPFLIDHELSASDGLMDLIDQYASEAIRPLEEGESLPPDWWLPLSDIGEYVLSINFAHFPTGGGIDLLPAGRQSESYAVKVSAFNWQNFYDRLGGGGFLDAVRRHAQSVYDYVLIDSRTGVSDTAGICTAQLPDTLVVCFTYNNQSIKGAAAVAASAQRLHAEVRHRQSSDPAAGVADTPVPYRIFPVPMRVDTGESERLAQRQTFAREAFAGLLDRDSIIDPAQYWSEVEVPHRVFYAYEEVLAPFKDDVHDPKTVLAAFLRMTRYVTRGNVQEYHLPLEPAFRQRLLEAFAETPRTATAHPSAAQPARETDEQMLLRKADTALLTLPEDQRELARSLLCRLVRVTRDEEGGRSYPIRAGLQDFTAEQQAVVGALVKHGVLTVNTEVKTRRGTRAQPSEQVVSLADERLVSHWPLLQGWLNEDRDFLLWRQQMRDYRTDWKRIGERSALLTGTLLGEAQLWARKRPEDLNSAEHGFIAESLAAAQNQAQEVQLPLPAPPMESVSAPKMSEAGSTASDIDKLEQAPRRKHSLAWATAAGVAVAGVLWMWMSVPREAMQVRKLDMPSVGAPPVLPTAAPNSGATDPYQAAQIYRAEQALAATPLSDAQLQRRKAVTVEYFAPDEGGVRVQTALESLGFSFHLKKALIPGAKANSLWYSLPVRPEDVRVAALALIQAGIRISAIRPIALGAPGRDKPLIQIGADVSLEATERYSVERILQSGFAVLQLLDGYTVDIYYYASDPASEPIALDIESHLRLVGFRGNIIVKSRRDQFMSAMPAKAIEVRYQSESETAAADELLKVVSQVPTGIPARKVPVKAKSTPRIISVLIPRSKER